MLIGVPTLAPPAQAPLETKISGQLVYRKRTWHQIEPLDFVYSFHEVIDLIWQYWLALAVTLFPVAESNLPAIGVLKQPLWSVWGTVPATVVIMVALDLTVVRPPAQMWKVRKSA